MVTLHAIKVMLRRRMHEPANAVGVWLKRVVSGYYRYNAVAENLRAPWRSVTGCAICGGRCLAVAVSGLLKQVKIADKGQNLERLGRHLKQFGDASQASINLGIQLVHD